MASRFTPVLTARRGSRRMRLIVALSAALALGLPGSVVASSPPVVVHEAFDLTFQVSGLTNICGYPVFSSLAGTVTVVVHYDADGNPDREVDAGVLTRTFIAPSTGRSVSFPTSLNAVADYAPDGSAIVKFSGMVINVHSAGGPPVRFIARHEVWSAVIAEIRPDGVPIWELIDLLEKSGTDQGDPADICLALDP